MVCYLGEVTYDAVRRWSQGIELLMKVVEQSEVTYDAVRRWSPAIYNILGG